MLFYGDLAIKDEAKRNTFRLLLSLEKATIKSTETASTFCHFNISNELVLCVNIHLFFCEARVVYKLTSRCNFE